MKLTEAERFIDKLLSNDFVIYSPVKRDEEIFVEQIENAKDVDWSSELPVYPFKHIFLPHKEALSSFIDGKFKPKFSDRKTVAFGMNILDLRAFTLFEHVFEKDIYYQKRRQNTIVVGFANGIEDDLRKFHAFQPEYEGNVLEHLVFDIFIERQKDGNLLFFSGSEIGEEILEKYGISDYENIAFAGLVSEAGVSPVILNNKKAVENNENHKLWNELAEICLSCGKCSIVCPTCFCFDMKDEPTLNSVHKTRQWSSCFYPEFSKVAGHKELDSVKKRLYFWYYHKFVRIPSELSYYGCVGCGRCARTCPVGINIRDNLKRLAEEKAEALRNSQVAKSSGQQKPVWNAESVLKAAGVSFVGKVTIKEIKGEDEKPVFRIDCGDSSYALKIFSDKGDGQYYTNTIFNQLARENKISTPRIIHASDDCNLIPAPWILWEWFQGKPLCGFQSDAEKRSAAVKAGQLLRRLHEISVNGFGQPKPNGAWSESNVKGIINFFVNRINNLTEKGGVVFSKEEILDIISVVDDKKLTSFNKPCLLHGDITGGNVLVAESGDVSFIDPGEIIAGDPMSDLGYSQTTRLSSAFREGLWAGYTAKAPLTAEENGRFLRWRLLRQCVIACRAALNKDKNAASYARDARSFLAEFKK